MQAPLLNNILTGQLQSSEAAANAVNPKANGASGEEFMNLLSQLGEGSSPEAQAEVSKLLSQGEESKKSLELLNGSKNSKVANPIIGNETSEELTTLLGKEAKSSKSLGSLNMKGDLLAKGNAENADLIQRKPHLFEALSPLQVGAKNQKTKALNISTPGIQSGDDFVKNMSITNKEHIISVQDGMAKQTQVSNFNSYAKGRDLLDNHIIKASVPSAVMNGGHEGLFDNSVEGESSQLGPKLELVQNQETSLAWSQSEGGETESGNSKTSQTTKVLDLSNIKAENKAALIGKISQYIEQTKLQNTDSLDLLVKHDDLGQFKVTVNKAPTAIPGSNMLDLQIQAATKGGHNFFVENEAELVKTLSDAGVKLADVKILKGSELSLVSDSSSKGFDSNSENSSSFESRQNSSKQQKQSGDRDSQRRQEMWEYYKEKATA